MTPSAGAELGVKGEGGSTRGRVRGWGRAAVRISLWPVVLGLGLCLPTAVMAYEEHSAARWRFAFANDAFLRSDNQFSNGLTLQLHSPRASHLSATRGTPAFGKALARLVLPAGRGWMYREAWGLAQGVQNPDDLERSTIQLDDVPYVGMLAWTNSFIAFNDREMVGLQTLVGWVGPWSFGEDMQRAAHRMLAVTPPRGWEHQLGNEPLLNIYVMRKRKLWRVPGADIAFSSDAALGNVYTQVQTALEWRLGRLPRGFAPQLAAVGRSVEHDGRMRWSGRTYAYATVALRGSAFMFVMPRDGNLLRRGNRWTRENTLDPALVVGQAVLGAHLERRAWSVHAHVVLATDAVRGLGRIKDPRNEFGVISVEWQF